MSKRHELQDATGVLGSIRPDGIMDIVQRTTPTNSQAGYAIGCIWRNLAGTVGSILYVNVGTTSSSTWLNIT